MKHIILVFFMLALQVAVFSQYVYTIKADSVKITSNNDSAELIIENHTRNIPGFLYNTGNGRTAFKRALQKVNDTLYLVGSDSLRLPSNVISAWVQGGNSFGATGVLGTKDNHHLDFYTNNTRRARLDSLGNLLLGFTTATNGYKLDVNGGARIYCPTLYLNVSSGDSYDIRTIPSYNSGWGTSVDASFIAFGNILGSMGINKQTLGNIPASSLIIGKTAPGKVTALIDYSTNPLLTVNGWSELVINGGYNGITTGGTVGSTANANSLNFNINGGRGTGSGATGDIIFSTDSSVASGTSIHPMINRWWLKGGTGYLSNTSSPSSVIDITGPNGYSQLRLRTSYTPSSTSDTNGNVGDFSWDSNYFYIKTASGWKRAPLSTF